MKDHYKAQTTIHVFVKKCFQNFHFSIFSQSKNNAFKFAFKSVISLYKTYLFCVIYALALSEVAPLINVRL
jgi:hypothetical protein